MIRNCITHAYGDIRQDRDPEKIKEIAKRDIGVELLGPELRIDQRFLEFALDLIEEFFRRIFKARKWKAFEQSNK